MRYENHTFSRRKMLEMSAVGALGALAWGDQAWATIPGERPERSADVQAILPLARVPVNLIIDDSTCLVNLAHFAIPQFAEVFPNNYKQDWRKLPREIPDSFVREFADYCTEHGVKGKYSIVPYPACVGWVDRDMPGWSKKELLDSLDLVRKEITPNWDIHPEMVSHTWVINTKTGRPYEERSERFMENWRWTDGKSVDELTDYLSYALRVLKQAGLQCEGITTPGGFGNRALKELSLASLQSCRDVYNAEIPHYFRHLYTGSESVVPRVENAKHLGTDHPECVVSIIGCTGDWFGGWDGLEIGHVDQFITADLKSGRMVEVIDRGEPACMVCHWPGIYCNGEKFGFQILKDIVARLHEKYDNLIWMKLSELSRYWAAKELTSINRTENTIQLRAPFASPNFTIETKRATDAPVKLVTIDAKSGMKSMKTLVKVDSLRKISSGTYFQSGDKLTIAFDLSKGSSTLEV